MDLSVKDIEIQFEYWIGLTAETVYGENFGNDLHSIIATPHSANIADEQIEKLRDDLPITEIIPQNSINLYSVNIPPDRVDIILQIGDKQFNFEQ